MPLAYRRLTAFTAAVLVTLTGATIASGAFKSTPAGGPQTVAAATLAAAGNPTSALGTCQSSPWTQPVSLTWTATISSFADGEKVLRATTSGGPYTVIATLARTAATYSDTATAFSTTYYYKIRATKLNWTADSGQSTAVTTKNKSCV